MLPLTLDLSRLLAPLSLIIFAVLADIGTRLLAPQLRDYLPPLLGIPQTIWRWLQQKLARNNRTSVELQKRGVLAVIIMATLGILLAKSLTVLARLHDMLIYGVWFCIWGWSIGWTLARDVLRLPTPTPAAMRIIAQRRDAFDVVPDQGDAATFYRLTILAICQTLVGGLAAPLCYALLAALCGYPSLYGALIGILAATIKAPAGLDMTQRLFHRPANALAQLLLYVPGRLIAVIMVLATVFTPKAKTATAVTVTVQYGYRYPDQSIAWLVTIISGAFGVAFPMQTGQAWLGNSQATAQIGRGVLQRVVWLHVVTVMLLVLILCAGLLLSM